MYSEEIWMIVFKKRDLLKELWYDVSDENMEILINWFIKIANSMITDNMNKIPNIDMVTFITKLSPYKITINNENNSKNNINQEDEEIINKGKLIMSHLVINETLYKLENWDYDRLIDEKLTKKDIEKILNSHNLIEKYNKWELNEKENKIIIELLNNL